MLYFLFFYILCRKDRPICPACAEKEKHLSKQVGNGGRMDNMNGILMIGISFALILLIAAMRSRTDLLINFIMRAVLGTLAIYFINMFLGSRDFPGMWVSGRSVSWYRDSWGCRGLGCCMESISALCCEGRRVQSCVRAGWRLSPGRNRRRSCPGQISCRQVLIYRTFR